jgi:hypothetical protein
MKGNIIGTDEANRTARKTWVVSSALMPPETAIRRMTPKREPMY